MTHLGLVLVALAPLALAQQGKGPITQSTAGVCSQAVVAGGNVTITCSGLDESQKQILLKVPALLDQILKKQVDQKALFEKLDELLKGQNIVLQELLTIRENAAPRVVTPEHRKALVTELQKYKGQSYTLGSVSSDKEAFDFATEINEVLLAAGWVPKDLTLGRLMLTGRPATGVALSAASEDHQVGLILLNLLHNHGVDIRGTLDPELPRDQVRIHVYPKTR